MAVRQYIGARYVPKFMGTYDPTTDYEALCVVDNGLGTSYIAKVPTPAGTPLTDTDYWIISGSTNGAIIQLQNDVAQLQNDYSALDGKVDGVKVNPTVADLIANTALVAGDVAFTGGFYAAGDGGDGTYLIDNVGTPDNMFVFAMSNGLYAKLIYKDSLNVLQIGAHGDGLTDDTAILQAAMNNAQHVILPGGTYLISSTLTPAAGNNISGVPESFDRLTPIILTNSNIKMVAFANGNITLSDIVLQHPDANTQPVTDFTGARYIKLLDVKFNHLSNASNIGIWSDPLSADWNGYLIFERVYCSNYVNSINLTTATLTTCTDCKFNNTSDHNIVYTGEIINLRTCEISNQINKAPIKYDGIYGVDMSGCYAEDLRAADLLKKMQTYGYMINDGMKYSWTRVANNYSNYAYNAAFHVADGNAPNVLKRFNDGYDGQSLLINGAFEYDKYGWNVEAAAGAVVQNCNDVNYAKELYCQFTGGANIEQTIANLPKGIYTMQAMFKLEDCVDPIDLNFFVCHPSDNTKVYARGRFTSVDSIPNGKWHLFTMCFESPCDPSVTTLRVRIRGTSAIKKMHLTGIGLFPGVTTKTIVGSSGKNGLMANPLIIRGSDQLLYQITVNGGVISATQVS